MVHKERVNKNLAKFAHILGDLKDKDGNVPKVGRNREETNRKRRQQLFWVRHTIMDNPHGSFVTGDRVIDFIREDKWDVEYIGLSRNAQTNKRYRKKVLEQVDDLVAGEKARNERNGDYRDDSYYEKQIQKRKAELQEKFDKIDEGETDNDDHE